MTIECPSCLGIGRVRVTNFTEKILCAICGGRGRIPDYQPPEKLMATVPVVTRYLVVSTFSGSVGEEYYTHEKCNSLPEARAQAERILRDGNESVLMIFAVTSKLVDTLAAAFTPDLHEVEKPGLPKTDTGLG